MLGFNMREGEYWKIKREETKTPKVDGTKANKFYLNKEN
jgi:hypothetical protein